MDVVIKTAGGNAGGFFLSIRSRWVAAAFVLLVVLMGCRRAPQFHNASVILISIDTLRSDHLPAYGATAIHTPAIDALRRDSILYQHAYSQVPLTLPSHVTILSGLLPGHHGVRDNVGYSIDPRRQLLPQLLAARGYATGGFVSSYVLRGESGIGPAFAAYDSAIELRLEEPLGNSQRPGAETAARALEWLGGVGSKPFFLFLHLYEPHSPYNPPEPYRSQAPTGYDGEIVAADAVVGSFLGALEKRGLYDPTIIVLLSDHGEGLADHGEREHGVTLYREALQVPLLLKLPGRRTAGTTVAAPVGLCDVAPSLLALVGAPPQAFDGQPLPLADAPEAKPRDLFAESYYGPLHLGWSQLDALIRGAHHYIEAPRPELYDLVRDPAERHNLWESERRTSNELRAALRPAIVGLAPPAPVDADTARALAALGYLHSATAPGSGQNVDPKDHLASLQVFGDALELIAKGDQASAVGLLERVVAENPGMVDAWETLGRALLAVGKAVDAKAAYEKALQASGGTGNSALGLARAMILLGDLDGAAAAAQLAVGASPSMAHGTLRQIAVERGDLEAAEREARLALESRGSRVGPLVSLAEVLLARNKLAEARTLAEQADREGRALHSRNVEELRMLLGQIEARLGNAAEAERLFNEAIAENPARLRTYARLAQLYVGLRRPADAVAALQRMTDSNPTPEAYAEAVRALRLLGATEDAGALLRYARGRFPGAPALADLRPGPGATR